MIVRHPGIIGFVQYALFPALGLFIELGGYVTGSPAPISALAGLYPISLGVLAVYTPLLSRVFPNPSDAIVRFARGAYYAAIALAIVAFGLSGIVLFAYHEQSIGFGVLFVGIGSMWLPVASAGAGYGKMLAASEEGSKNFLSELRQGRVFETAAVAWLSILLGQWHLVRLGMRAIFFLSFSLALCVLGWVFVGIAGGFLLTVFALLVLFIYLLVVALEARTWVPSQGRRQISESITASMPAL